MKMNWFFNTGVAAVSLMALVACSSTTTGTGGAGGATDTTSTSSGTGGELGTGGTSPYTGSKSCNDYITGNDWSQTLTMSDFSSEAGYTAWTNLNSCACTTTSTTNSCVLVCNSTANPGFCAGTAPVAGGQCVTCLQMSAAPGCGTEYTACTSN
jgi:hypothetical protein